MGLMWQRKKAMARSLFRFSVAPDHFGSIFFNVGPFHGQILIENETDSLVHKWPYNYIFTLLMSCRDNKS